MGVGLSLHLGRGRRLLRASAAMPPDCTRIRTCVAASLSLANWPRKKLTKFIVPTNERRPVLTYRKPALGWMRIVEKLIIDLI